MGTRHGCASNDSDHGDLTRYELKVMNGLVGDDLLQVDEVRRKIEAIRIIENGPLGLPGGEAWEALSRKEQEDLKLQVEKQNNEWRAHVEERRKKYKSR